MPRVLHDRAAMTPRERAELVLSFARLLYVNGESTDETIVAAEGLGASVTPDAAVRAEFRQLLLVMVARSCEFSFPAWPSFRAHRWKAESSEKGERRC